MYPLIQLCGDGEGRAVLRQGRPGAIRFARAAELSGFIDGLMAHGTGAAVHEFKTGRQRWRRLLPARQVGLLSSAPLLLRQLSVRDNLGLAEQRYRGETPFWRAAERALADTGLLHGVDPDGAAGALPLPAQIELNFLQAWLCEPQCLVLDRLAARGSDPGGNGGDGGYGSDGSDGNGGNGGADGDSRDYGGAVLARLLALFSARFPLRTVCHVELLTRRPAPDGVAPDAVIELA